MSWIGLVGEAVHGDAQHTVKQSDLFEIFWMLTQPPSEFHIEILLERCFIFVEHLRRPQSSEVVPVDNHGNAPLRMPEATWACFALNTSC